MSPAMLSALIKMLLAEASECHFELLILSGVQNQFCTLAKVAQEAAKVFIWDDMKTAAFSPKMISGIY